MTELDGVSGDWLDMSRYPDADPDVVLTADQHDLLSSSLAVDDGDLPDTLWEHMLATVLGGDTDADDPPVDADGDPGAVDDGATDDASWSFADPAADLTVDEHDPGWVDDHHDGGEGDHTGGWDGAS